MQTVKLAAQGVQTQRRVRGVGLQQLERLPIRRLRHQRKCRWIANGLDRQISIDQRGESDLTYLRLTYTLTYQFDRSRFGKPIQPPA